VFSSGGIVCSPGIGAGGNAPIVFWVIFSVLAFVESPPGQFLEAQDPDLEIA
jgi:hypothetical protein